MQALLPRDDDRALNGSDIGAVNREDVLAALRARGAANVLRASALAFYGNAKHPPTGRSPSNDLALLNVRREWSITEVAVDLRSSAASPRFNERGVTVLSATRSVARFGVLLSIIYAATLSASFADPSLAVPNTSNHAPTGSPIEIESCTTGTQGGLLVAQTDGSFKIVFTNEGSTTADLVRFQVELGGERIYIRDVGSYSPGTTITHVFRRRGGNVVSSPLFGAARLTCDVAAVHFVDGSKWTPPSEGSVVSNASAHQLQSLGDGFIGVQWVMDQSAPIIHLVMPGGPASLGGLTQGDTIRQINGQRVDTIDDAVALITASPVGTPLDVTADRDGQSMNFTIVVGHRPQPTN